MMASLPADQEIDQAIERLQKKMQAVSDNLDRGRPRRPTGRDWAGSHSE